jgi:hypothetical protein
VQFLQDTGVLLSRKAHRVHHTTFAVATNGLHLATFSKPVIGYGFSFYNGLAGPLLDYMADHVLHYSDLSVFQLAFYYVNGAPIFVAVLALFATVASGHTSVSIPNASQKHPN